jgi:hypothetical protein
MPHCSPRIHSHGDKVRNPEKSWNIKSRSLYRKERWILNFVRPNFVDPWIEGSKLCTVVDRKVRN